MNDHLLGIHHITTLASDPQRNLDFYVKLMGMRLVKQTVNYDDPGTYHFYFGDNAGTPGTILTFFPFPNTSPGKRGRGQVTAVMYAIAPESISFWVERLSRQGIKFDGPTHRFDEEVIAFDDPDGMRIELVAHAANVAKPTYENRFVPAEHVARGFYGVTLASLRLPSTLSLLTRTMGFANGTESTDRVRLTIGEPSHSTVVDLDTTAELQPGQMSAGSVHHIAWRVADDNSHSHWRGKIAETGVNVTPIIDRNYFHSIYYREPGGVLYEIATDPPGFTVDESPEQLGSRLQLPPWLEPERERLMRRLPPIVVPSASGVS